MEKADRKMGANDLTPAFPTHPGAILKDEVHYCRISYERLAAVMEVPVSDLSAVLSGQRPLTESMALLFEAVLGIEAEPLLRLQEKYDFLSKI